MRLSDWLGPEDLRQPRAKATWLRHWRPRCRLSPFTILADHLLGTGERPRARRSGGLQLHQFFKGALPAPQFFGGWNELLQHRNHLGGDGTAVLTGAGAQGLVEVLGHVFHV